MNSTKANNEDSLLVSAISNGSYNAFEKVFKSYYNQLCAFAIGFLKDKDATEELVQQVFFNYWEKREQIKIQTSIKAYLYQSVRNASFNALKHEQVKAQAHIELSQTDEGEIDYDIEQNEMAIAINNAVEKMPAERRRIFKLSKYEDKKYREIAAELDISIKTVENQMGKALKFLRTELAHLVSLIIFLCFDQWG
ncbi:MAG: RNA polymerase sigma-70 factor [Bacteroidia bacterium]